MIAVAEEWGDRVAEWTAMPSAGTLAGVGLALVALLAAAIVIRRFRAAAAKKTPDDVALRIDVASLPDEGPPSGGPVLRYYGLPVRLAVVVLAPAGRTAELPPIDRRDELFDAVVPGLAGIIASHRALTRRWPNQVSVRGFAQQFFQQVRLPGDGGKGTPWNSVAGVFKIGGRPVMLGLVLRAESPTSLGRNVIEVETQWLDVLRIER